MLMYIVEKIFFSNNHFFQTNKLYGSLLIFCYRFTFNVVARVNATKITARAYAFYIFEILSSTFLSVVVYVHKCVIPIKNIKKRE